MNTCRNLKFCFDRNYHVLLLFLIMLFGTLFRTAQMDRTAWPDEPGTIIPARLPFSNFCIHYTRHDTHPPLFYFMARLFYRLGGNSLVMMRFFSAIGSVLALAGLLAWSRQFHSSSTIPVLIIGALSPLLIMHAHEARPYSWLAAGAAWTPWFVSRAGSSSGWRCGMALLLLAISMTHYYGLFILIPAFLVYRQDMLRHGQGLTSALKPFVPAAMAILFWVLVTQYTQFSEFSEHISDHFGAPAASTMISRLSKSTAGLFFWISGPPPLSMTLFAALMVINGIVIMVSVHRSMPPPVKFFIIPAVLIISVAAAAALFGQNLFRPRYVTPALPAAVIIAGYRIAMAGRYYRPFLLGSIIFFMLWSYTFITTLYFTHDHVTIIEEISEYPAPLIVPERAVFIYSADARLIEESNALIFRDDSLVRLDDTPVFQPAAPEDQDIIAGRFWYLFEDLSEEARNIDRILYSRFRKDGRILKEISMPTGGSRRLSLIAAESESSVMPAEVTAFNVHTLLNTEKWLFPHVRHPLLFWIADKPVPMRPIHEGKPGHWTVDLTDAEKAVIAGMISEGRYPEITYGDRTALIASMRHSMEIQHDGTVSIDMLSNSPWVEQPVIRKLLPLIASLLCLIEFMRLITLMLTKNRLGWKMSERIYE